MSNSRTLAFADYLAQADIPAWARYVLVPGISDAEEDMHELGRHLQGLKNMRN